jgi:hypothetical protein
MFPPLTMKASLGEPNSRKSASLTGWAMTATLCPRLSRIRDTIAIPKLGWST